MRIVCFVVGVMAVACADAPCETLENGACQAQDGCHAQWYLSGFACEPAYGPRSRGACSTLDREDCDTRDDCESHYRNGCEGKPPPCDANAAFDRCTEE